MNNTTYGTDPYGRKRLRKLSVAPRRRCGLALPLKTIHEATSRPAGAGAPQPPPGQRNRLPRPPNFTQKPEENRIVELARHVVGAGPQHGRELGGDQGSVTGELTEPPLRRATGIHRRRVQEDHPRPDASLPRPTLLGAALGPAVGDLGPGAAGPARVPLPTSWRRPRAVAQQVAASPRLENWHARTVLSTSGRSLHCTHRIARRERWKVLAGRASGLVGVRTRLPLRSLFRARSAQPCRRSARPCDRRLPRNSSWT